jgi:formylmethanofuran dehydrogenase subunit E
MKKPSNRMARVETMEVDEVDAGAPMPAKAPAESRCPTCDGETIIISERVANNRIIRERRCEKCKTRFTEGA